MRKLVLLVFLGLAGCFSLSWQKPELSLADVRLAGGNLFEQRLKLQLRVRNPNDREIEVESVIFDVLVGEEKFASGQSNAPVKIPKRGEILVELDAKVQLLNLMHHLQSQGLLDGKLHYRIKGEAQITGYGRAPFDHPGELDVGKLQGLGGSRQSAVQ